MKTTIRIQVEAGNENQRRDMLSHAIQSAMHMGHVQQVLRSDKGAWATITIFSEDRDIDACGSLAANRTF